MEPEDLFLFDPNEPAGGQPISSPATQTSAPMPPDLGDDDLGFPVRGVEGSTVSAAQSPSPAPAQPQPAPRSQAPPQPSQQAVTSQQAQEWQSIASAMRAEGLDPGSGDDREAFQSLVRMARQGQQAEYNARLYPQSARGFGQPQPGPAQAAQPEIPNPWSRPQFDRAWLPLLEGDETTGLYVAKPGVSPALAEAANRYVDWYKRREDDPEGYIAHVVQPVIQKAISDALQNQFQQRDNTSAAQQILSQHSGWLYSTDPTSGQVLRDLAGRPSFSPAGQRYAQLVQEANQMGIRDPRHADKYAVNTLRGEILQAQSQQGQSQQAQARPQTQQAQRRPNSSPANQQNILERAMNPASVEPTRPGFSLRDALTHELNSAGVQDADIEFSANN